jgi:hypothetical protein
MLKFARKLWRTAENAFPFTGFHFDRPLVLFQSDDWGRVGVRDREGADQLRAAGITIGERPYDCYSLETGDDLGALRDVLKRHHDSAGRSPCIEMNFILANLDFARMRDEDFGQIHSVPLHEGLPHPWARPGLLESYRDGIADGVFYPSLHGTTHFCRSAVERAFAVSGERKKLLGTMWQAATPYIHWRMPWIGYEYWDAENPEDERFLPLDTQRELVGQAVGVFAKMFSTLPQSACAPGYRANEDTNRAWAQHGIRVAQNGPGMIIAPYFEHDILQICRTVEFEPATNESVSVENCLKQAELCFERGIPAIVSVHSINFHSTVQDFRRRTLQLLNEFLTVLEATHDDLLYVHDEDLYHIVDRGLYEHVGRTVPVHVQQKKFIRSKAERLGEV